MGARSGLGSRTTGDLLVLLIASTICLAVVTAGIAVFVLTLFQPDRDVSAAFGVIADIITTLLGLLAGFLAGRTDSHLMVERAVAADRAERDRADRADIARAKRRVREDPAGTER